jgi:endonuclease-3
MSWKGRLVRNSERPWRTPDETRSSLRALKEKLVRVTRLLEKHFGIPRPGNRGDLLDVLIGTILSQNTNDRSSNLAFEKLKKGFPCWGDVLASDLKSVVRTLRSGGLARQKAKRIREILRWLKRKHGRLSLDFLKKMDSETIITTLSQLRGVGPKTIHCLLLFGLKRDEFPVDTHILRIGKRLGFIPERMNASQAHVWMAPLVPDRKSLSLHINLIRFGRSVCRAVTPRCNRCFLRGDCLSPG